MGMGEKSKGRRECAVDRINPQTTPQIPTLLKNEKLPNEPISDFRLYSVQQQLMPIHAPHEPGKRTHFSPVAPTCLAEVSRRRILVRGRPNADCSSISMFSVRRSMFRVPLPEAHPVQANPTRITGTFTPSHRSYLRSFRVVNRMDSN